MNTTLPSRNGLQLTWSPDLVSNCTGMHLSDLVLCMLQKNKYNGIPTLAFQWCHVTSLSPLFSRQLVCISKKYNCELFLYPVETPVWISEQCSPRSVSVRGVGWRMCLVLLYALGSAGGLGREQGGAIRPSKLHLARGTARPWGCTFRPNVGVLWYTACR